MLNLDDVRKAAGVIRSCVVDDISVSDWDEQSDGDTVAEKFTNAVDRCTDFAALLTSTEPITSKGCKRLGLTQGAGDLPFGNEAARLPPEAGKGALTWWDGDKNGVEIDGDPMPWCKTLGQLAALIVALTPWSNHAD